MSILFCLAFVFIAFYGDSVLLISLLAGDSSFLTYENNLFFVIVAVIADAILLLIFFKKLQPHLVSSFQLAYSGVKKRLEKRKKIKNVKVLIENENVYLNRLNELRRLGIKKNEHQSVRHLCELIMQISKDEKIGACYSKIMQNENTLSLIADLEANIYEIANFYKNNGNFKKTQYYYDMIKESLSQREQEAFLQDYETNQLLYEEEKEAITIWAYVILCIIIVGSLIIVYVVEVTV